MDTLEQALEELRRWSSPGRRAELIAEAWRHGETNVSTLAEAARVTRQTVYTDLESCGIDPHDDRRRAQEPLWLQPAESWPAGDAETEDDAWRAILGKFGDDPEWRPTGPPRTRGEKFLALAFGQWQYSRYHRAVLPAARDEYEARLGATRAIHRAEVKWEALRTARHWAAAHHQWIEAVDDARRAIGAWAAAAKVHLDLESHANLADFRMEGQGAVPDDRRIPPCSITEATLAATEFEETYRHRRNVASVTLSASGGA